MRTILRSPFRAALRVAIQYYPGDTPEDSGVLPHSTRKVTK